MWSGFYATSNFDFGLLKGNKFMVTIATGVQSDHRPLTDTVITRPVAKRQPNANINSYKI